MAHEDSSDNVFGLFPGIDTAPFGAGRGSESSESSVTDDGWSATPEPTVTDEANLDGGAGYAATHPDTCAREAHHRPGASAPALRWLAVAVLAGGLIAVARVVLSPTSSSKSPTLMSNVPHAATSRQRSRSQTTQQRHHSDRQRASGERRRVRAPRATHARPIVVAAKYAAPSNPSPSQTSLQQAPTYPEPQSIETANTSSGGQSEGHAGSAAAASHYAGPTGPGALTGAGSTPSG